MAMTIVRSGRQGVALFKSSSCCIEFYPEENGGISIYTDAEKWRAPGTEPKPDTILPPSHPLHKHLKAIMEDRDVLGQIF